MVHDAETRRERGRGRVLPTSVDDAYEGRPAVVRLEDDSLLLTYHTLRRHGWDIWGKRFADGDWQPSEPIVDRPGVDKHPTIARQGSRLWLFWETYGSDGVWHLASRTRTSGGWSAVEIVGDAATERRLPAAAADDTGGLWLFWLERLGDGWQIRYNRHDGTDWQLPQPATLPRVTGGQATTEDLIADLPPHQRRGTAVPVLGEPPAARSGRSDALDRGLPGKAGAGPYRVGLVAGPPPTAGRRSVPRP